MNVLAIQTSNNKTDWELTKLSELAICLDRISKGITQQEKKKKWVFFDKTSAPNIEPINSCGSAA